MDFVKNFKSLPSKTKNLMSFGIIIALVVALPLFVWALTNLNFDLREKAATGEPPVGTPINWSTGSVSITADDFYVVSNNKRYFEDPQYTTINPSPILYSTEGMSTSIEIVSNQYGNNLRAQIDFKSNSDQWWIEKIKLNVTNENVTNWNSEYNNPIPNKQLGTFYLEQGTRSMGFVDYSSGTTVGVVNALNFKVIAFNEMATTADLMIEDISVNRISPPNTACESYKYVVKIRNIGTDPVFKTRVKTSFIPSTQQAFNNCTEIRAYESSSAPIPSLESQLYVMPNQTYEYSDYFNPTSDGTIILTSEIDYNHTYAEQNESNNTLSKTINVIKLYPNPEPPTTISLDIITNSFINGIVGESYRNTFYGEVSNYTTDPQLTLNAVNIPSGLSIPNALCGTSYPVNSGIVKRIECALDGIPTTAGNYTLQATLSDNLGNSISKDIPITILPSSSNTPLPKTGDINGDGKVNIVDIGIIIDNYGASNPTFEEGDINGDGKVNIVDIGIIIDNYIY